MLNPSLTDKTEEEGRLGRGGGGGQVGEGGEEEDFLQMPKLRFKPATPFISSPVASPLDHKPFLMIWVAASLKTENHAWECKNVQSVQRLFCLHRNPHS